MSQFILILNGPPDAGQAGVTKVLMREEERFHASTNEVKFRISGYSAEKTDRSMLNAIVLGEAQAARSQGLSLIVQGSDAILRRWWVEYETMAEKSNAKFVQVNLEAPYEVLVKRFNERVNDAQILGKPISIWDVSELRKRYDTYRHLKNPALPTFDSSVDSPEQIAQEIEKLLA